MNTRHSNPESQFQLPIHKTQQILDDHYINYFIYMTLIYPESHRFGIESMLYLDILGSGKLTKLISFEGKYAIFYFERDYICRGLNEFNYWVWIPSCNTTLTSYQRLQAIFKYIIQFQRTLPVTTK